MPELSAFRVTDREAWNAFVEQAPYRSFPQLWEWGELREPSGWRPVRIAVGERPSEPLAGAQVLVRRTPLVGWRLGYAPRGPIGRLDDPAIRGALVAALRDLGRTERIATLKVDPEATATDPLGAALLAAPWRRSSKVQPPRTRVIDLSLPEDDLLAALRQKHRQYVHKAERAGVTVAPVDSATDATADLADFYRIYSHTAERAGFVVRAPAYYARVWRLFAPSGHARLFFATLDGARVATLFHFTCGDRAAEAYGGMTDAGATSRANYLLKWEAIRAFRADGFAVYDLWGIATGGIGQFKEGFGGRRIDYVGARDLALRSAQDTALRLILPAYGIAQRARLRLSGRRLAGSDD
jgi:lipid II:glycine glycyltransferase (peptidoglycan interpeptide bridge formation enzyme)